jgi:hypothetical protein
LNAGGYLITRSQNFYRLTICFGSQQNQLFKLQSSSTIEKTLEDSALLNFAKGFLHKQIARNICHNIHAKSQEGNLTEKRADSKKSNNIWHYPSDYFHQLTQYLNESDQNNFRVEWS